MAKKTLSLSSKKLELKKVVDSGQIRQSFPHGKSKSVSFEVKKKRFLDKESLAQEKQEKIKSSISEQTGLSNKEIEARKVLLQQASDSHKSLSNEMNKSQQRLAEIEREKLSALAKQQQTTAPCTKEKHVVEKK